MDRLKEVCRGIVEVSTGRCLDTRTLTFLGTTSIHWVGPLAVERENLITAKDWIVLKYILNKYFISNTSIIRHSIRVTLERWW
jgi:hypothetical protein